MFSRRIFVTAFAFFTLGLTTACPHDIARSVAETDTLTKEYNDRADTANRTASELRRDYEINVNGWFVFGIATYNWSKHTPSVLKDIRTKLTNHSINIGRMIELAKHKNLSDRVSITERMNLDDSARNTKDYLTALDKHEAIPARSN